GLLAAGEIAHERNIRGEPWDRQRRELDYGDDLLASDPLRRDAAPGAAVAVQFAALDCPTLLGAPRISRDLTDRGPELVREHRRVDERRRAGRRRAHVESLVGLQAVPSLDAGRGPGVAGAQVARDAADPGDVGKLEPDFVDVEQRLRDQSRVERG